MNFKARKPTQKSDILCDSFLTDTFVLSLIGGWQGGYFDTWVQRIPGPFHHVFMKTFEQDTILEVQLVIQMQQNELFSTIIFDNWCTVHVYVRKRGFMYLFP